MTKPLALATLLETDGNLRAGTFNLGMSNLVTGSPSVGDTVSYSVTGTPPELFNAVGGSPMLIGSAMGGYITQIYPNGYPYDSILMGSGVFAVQLTSSDPAWDSLPDLTAYNEQTVTLNYLDGGGTARTLLAKIIDDPSLFMVPAGSARSIIFYDTTNGADVGYAFQGPDGISQIVQIFGQASGEWVFTSNSADTSSLISSATIDSAFNDVTGAQGSPITATHDTLAELANVVSSVSGTIATAFPEFYAPSGQAYSKVFQMNDIIGNQSHNWTEIGTGNGRAFLFDDRATGGTCNINPKMTSVSRNGVRQIDNVKNSFGNQLPNWSNAYDYQIGKIVPESSGGTETFQEHNSNQLHSINTNQPQDPNGSGLWIFSIGTHQMSWASSMANQTTVKMYLYEADGTTPYAGLGGSVDIIRETTYDYFDTVNFVSWSINVMSIGGPDGFNNWLDTQMAPATYPGQGMKCKFSTGGGTIPASFTEVSTQDGSVGDIYFPNGLDANDRLVIRSF